VQQARVHVSEDLPQHLPRARRPPHRRERLARDAAAAADAGANLRRLLLAVLQQRRVDARRDGLEELVVQPLRGKLAAVAVEDGWGGKGGAGRGRGGEEAPITLRRGGSPGVGCDAEAG
jgi:hypothetical protein